MLVTREVCKTVEKKAGKEEEKEEASTKEHNKYVFNIVF